MTLQQLHKEMTVAELMLWAGYFTLQSEEQEKAMNESRTRRR